MQLCRPATSIKRALCRRDGLALQKLCHCLLNVGNVHLSWHHANNLSRALYARAGIGCHPKEQHKLIAVRELAWEFERAALRWSFIGGRAIMPSATGAFRCECGGASAALKLFGDLVMRYTILQQDLERVIVLIGSLLALPIRRLHPFQQQAQERNGLGVGQRFPRDGRTHTRVQLAPERPLHSTFQKLINFKVTADHRAAIASANSSKDCPTGCLCDGGSTGGGTVALSDTGRSAPPSAPPKPVRGRVRALLDRQRRRGVPVAASVPGSVVAAIQVWGRGLSGNCGYCGRSSCFDALVRGRRNSDRMPTRITP